MKTSSFLSRIILLTTRKHQSLGEFGHILMMLIKIRQLCWQSILCYHWIVEFSRNPYWPGKLSLWCACTQKCKEENFFQLSRNKNNSWSNDFQSSLIRRPNLTLWEPKLIHHQLYIFLGLHYFCPRHWKSGLLPEKRTVILSHDCNWQVLPRKFGRFLEQD